ncbi:DUF1778 domain-containing protein [Variovorax sp. J22P240]|uniref:type II toxin -antitoxin system TacA 1-like antitoxin n=1 Tax=Variovorax sp. J22P240 TaxID=3053514 RepID=UPI0025750C4F|nr:DUF1778 domain-containing protein [Variovorax sp. J22P240]MDM0001252.1 DUF1778 domain-containing protein [Variovorax sp. J22P240]
MRLDRSRPPTFLKRSAFMLAAACAHAQDVVLDQITFTLDVEGMHRFAEIPDEPAAATHPGLDRHVKVAQLDAERSRDLKLLGGFLIRLPTARTDESKSSCRMLALELKAQRTRAWRAS